MRYWALYIIIIFNVCCHQEIKKFVTYQSLQSEQLENNNKIKPNFQILKNWNFQIGSPQKGWKIEKPPVSINQQIVEIPHRINQPNTPLWYFKKVKLQQSKLLHLSADDGAQVFYDGKQLYQELPYCFLLPPTKDSVQLAIRVLNNALKGGLKKALLMDWKSGYDYFIKQHKIEKFSPYLGTEIEMEHPKESILFKPPFVQQKEGNLTITIEVNPTSQTFLLWGLDSLSWKKYPPSLKEKNVLTFQFNNLQTDKIYYYQIIQKKYRSPVYLIKIPNKELPFSFSAWGDSQGGWETFRELNTLMRVKPIEFSIGLGDLVADGSNPTQWNAFNNTLHPLAAEIPIFPVIGNHDYDGYYDNGEPELYKAFFRDTTWFSWKHKNCFFLALDPNERFPLGIEGKQLNWFKAQINSLEWKMADWRFVLIHQPPYAQGWPEYHGDDFIRELIEENAEAASIDFVLSGHSHCYERLSKKWGNQTTHFIILGGAGGGLEPPNSAEYPVMDTIIKKHHFAWFKVNKNKLNMEIIGLKGEVLDQQVFSK